MKEETNPTWKEVHGGFAKDMTLRDHFAGLAMQGICASGPTADWSNNRLATEAYELADAMLAAREAK